MIFIMSGYLMMFLTDLLTLKIIFYKKILIFFIEFSYGGDLRYGRLWSNIFTLIIGPFSLISDQATITAARIFNIQF